MRIVLITGASRGIGRATAQALAGPGTQLILTARTVKELEETDDLVRAKGGQSTLIQHDLRNFPGIQEMARSLGQRFQGLDGLVLNGGMLGRLQSVEDLDPVHFGEVMETNLIANFIFMKACAPLLRAAKKGQLIAVTTGAVPNPRAYWGAYAASKAGLEALTLAFSKEVEADFRVNLFDPGRVRTEMRATAYPGEDPMTVRAAEDVGQILADLILDTDLGTGLRLHANNYPA